MGPEKHEICCQGAGEVTIVNWGACRSYVYVECENAGTCGVYTSDGEVFSCPKGMNCDVCRSKGDAALLDYWCSDPEGFQRPSTQ